MSNTIIYGNVTGGISITSPITTDIDVAKINIYSNIVSSNSVYITNNNINTSNSSNITMNCNNITINGSMVNNSAVNASNSSGNINIACNNLTNIMGNIASSATVNGTLLVNGNITFSDGSVQSTAISSIGNSVVGTFTSPTVTVNNKGQITTIANGAVAPSLVPGSYTNSSITVNSSGQISLIGNGASGGGSTTVYINTNSASYIIPNNAGSDIFLTYTWNSTSQAGNIHLPYNKTGVKTITIMYNASPLSLTEVSTASIAGPGSWSYESDNYFYNINTSTVNTMRIYGGTTTVYRLLSDGGWSVDSSNYRFQSVYSTMRCTFVDTNPNYVGYTKNDLKEININSTSFSQIGTTGAYTYTELGNPIRFPSNYSKWILCMTTRIIYPANVSTTGKIYVGVHWSTGDITHLLLEDGVYDIADGLARPCGYNIQPINKSANNGQTLTNTTVLDDQSGQCYIIVGITNQPATFGSIQFKMSYSLTKLI